ncbi:hypothetical protein AB6A40_006941 [Gnathostoma spinigerum]|uniref:Uncharacterized protein n=1 Tax=Gnathostoma spinigerum TaxID=75299 RepID=A0ABD6EM06_9BILA
MLLLSALERATIHCDGESPCEIRSRPPSSFSAQLNSQSTPVDVRDFESDILQTVESVVSRVAIDSLVMDSSTLSFFEKSQQTEAKLLSSQLGDKLDSDVKISSERSAVRNMSALQRTDTADLRQSGELTFFSFFFILKANGQAN